MVRSARTGAVRALIASVAGLTIGAPTPAVAAPDLGAQLDALLTPHYRPDQPGAAVLVRKGEQVLLRKGYGLADVKKGRPVKPELVFRLGSLTKQFTAAAIMMLVEQGKLSLSDDIRKHLPSYPAHPQTITIEHLLTHTSGIPDYTDLPGFTERMAQDVQPPALVDRFKDLPLEFAPGAQMKYSNSGYHLLGLIIEKASGRPYARFVAERIFTPLGMTHSGYGDDPKLDRVLGYTRGKEGPAQLAPSIDMKIPYAAGALVSSVDDLARWDRAIRDGKLLNRQSWQRIFTPGRLNDGQHTDYGYGWSLGKMNDHPVQRHSGGIPGFTSHILRLPAEDLLVVVLANSIPGPVDLGLLVHRLALTALGTPLVDPPVAAIDLALLDRYAGVYKLPAARTFLVRREGDHLTVQPPRGPALPAWPESERRFFVKEHPIRFAFTVDPKGAVTELQITKPSGDIDLATRSTDKLPPGRTAITLAPALLDRYVGEYRLNPTFAITITRSGQQLYAQATNQPRLEIFASAPGEFFLKAVDAQLTFRAKGDASADELVLHQNGRDQPAKRVR